MGVKVEGDIGQFTIIYLVFTALSDSFDSKLISHPKIKFL